MKREKTKEKNFKRKGFVWQWLSDRERHNTHTTTTTTKAL